MEKPVKTHKFSNLWRKIRPWITFIALLVVLRYTGILAGISVFASSTLMDMGMMEAEPEQVTTDDYLDYNFKIKTLEGEAVDFNSFKGKTVFINLWATWCGPCRAEMPSIQKLYNKIDKDKIAFVMLSLDQEDQPKKVSKYIESKSFTFPVYIAGELPALLTVDMIPTTFVVAPDGKVVYRKSGMENYDSEKFSKFIESVGSSGQ